MICNLQILPAYDALRQARHYVQDDNKGIVLKGNGKVGGLVIGES